MKLLSKYNRINLLATVLVLLLSSVAYYFLIRHTLVHQLDKDLKIEIKEIKEYINENNTLPEPTNYKDEQEFYSPIKDSFPSLYQSISIYNKDHHEDVIFREVNFAVKAHNQFYKFTVRKSEEETEDLIKLILFITLAIVITLLIILLLINKLIFNKLWKPFSDTLYQLKNFDISKNKKFVLSPSDIDEFSRLNNVVTLMSDKALRDYNEIRNFTENASHEIQTPLAIIKSRLELLSQGEGLKEEQMDFIQSMFDAANRLSRLNQSLLLLTKIDNRQFREEAEVNISGITIRILQHYEELLSANHVTLKKHLKDNVTLKMNEVLAEILISNLITNAIRHNIDPGFINITITDQYLEITNSGLLLDVPPESLFERFKKEKTSSESLGLGLSIVKKICETYNFTIRYNTTGSQHIITINYNSTPNLLQN